MNNAIVETKQGFLSTARFEPTRQNFFSPHLSDAVRFDPVEADYFAERYDGSVHLVSCIGCGAKPNDPCEGDCSQRAGSGHRSGCVCADCSDAELTTRND